MLLRQAVMSGRERPFQALDDRTAAAIRVCDGRGTKGMTAVVRTYRGRRNLNPTTERPDARGLFLHRVKHDETGTPASRLIAPATTAHNIQDMSLPIQKKETICLAVTEKACTFATAIRGRSFEEFPDIATDGYAPLAQLVEQLTLNQWV